MRVLAAIFLLLTIVAVVLDVRAQAASPDLVLRPLGDVVEGLHRPTAEAFGQAVIETPLSILYRTPAAVQFGLAFLVFLALALVFRPRRRAYNIEPL